MAARGGRISGMNAKFVSLRTLKLATALADGPLLTWGVACQSWRSITYAELFAGVKETIVPNVFVSIRIELVYGPGHAKAGQDYTDDTWLGRTNENGIIVHLFVDGLWFENIRMKFATCSVSAELVGPDYPNGTTSTDGTKAFNPHAASNDINSVYQLSNLYIKAPV